MTNIDEQIEIQKVIQKHLFDKAVYKIIDGNTQSMHTHSKQKFDGYEVHFLYSDDNAYTHRRALVLTSGKPFEESLLDNIKEFNKQCQQY